MWTTKDDSVFCVRKLYWKLEPSVMLWVFVQNPWLLEGFPCSFLVLWRNINNVLTWALRQDAYLAADSSDHANASSNLPLFSRPGFSMFLFCIWVLYWYFRDKELWRSLGYWGIREESTMSPVWLWVGLSSRFAWTCTRHTMPSGQPWTFVHING